MILHRQLPERPLDLGLVGRPRHFQNVIECTPARPRSGGRQWRRILASMTRLAPSAGGPARATIGCRRAAHSRGEPGPPCGTHPRAQPAHDTAAGQGGTNVAESLICPRPTRRSSRERNARSAGPHPARGARPGSATTAPWLSHQRNP